MREGGCPLENKSVIVGMVELKSRCVSAPEYRSPEWIVNSLRYGSVDSIGGRSKVGSLVVGGSLLRL